MGGACSNVSHAIVPDTGAVSLARVARSWGSGRARASRLTRGKAFSRFTETIVRRGAVAGICCSLGTATSQQIATRAPWPVKMCASSRSVYSGLCCTTTAPNRSTA